MLSKTSPTFSGKNYRQWSLQAKAVLMVKCLWSIVDGSEAKEDDSEGGKGEISNSWMMRNDQAMGYILTMVDPAYQYLLMDAVDAKEMWSRLKDAFGRVDQKQYDQKLTEWVNFRIEHGEEPSKYGARLLSIAQELNIIALALKLSRKEDSEVVHRLLAAVEASGQHESMVQVLKYAKDITSQFALNELQYTHERNTGNNRELANYGSTRNKGIQQSVKHNNFTGACFWCGKKGHKASDCRAKKAGKPKTAGRNAGSNTEANTAVQKGEQAFSVRLSAHHTVSKAKFEDEQSWIVDTGASRHMTGNKSWFLDMKDLTQMTTVILGDNRELPVAREGTAVVYTATGSSLKLKNTLFVPGLKKNLLSFAQAEDDGFKMQSKSDANGKGILLHPPGGNSGILAARNGNLYVIEGVRTPKQEQGNIARTPEVEANTWHNRLAHVGYSTLKKMASTGNTTGLELKKPIVEGICDICITGKHSRTAFSKERHDRTCQDILDIVSSDVMGPLPRTMDGCEYTVNFVDEKSNFTAVFSLKRKSEVLEKFKLFQAQIERLTRRNIKHLRTDGGGEYCSNNFKQYLDQSGIIHIITAPHTPQDNGCAERKNRTLMEAARTMRLQSNLPQSFWFEALRTACYIRNRVSSTQKTPYEWIYGQKPSIGHIRPFGCAAWRHIPKEKQKSKLEARSEECILLGYEPGSRNYRLLTRNWVIVASRDVIFEEHRFPRVAHLGKSQEMTDAGGSKVTEDDAYSNSDDSSDEEQDAHPHTRTQRTAQKTPTQQMNPENTQSSDRVNQQQQGIMDLYEDEEVFRTPNGDQQTRTFTSKPTGRQIQLDRTILPPAQPMLRRSGRIPKIPGNWWQANPAGSIPEGSYHACLISKVKYCLAVGDDGTKHDLEPQTFKEAKTSKQKSKWEAAMDEEMASLLSNNVWELVELPKGRSTITCKWVYKIKYNPDRSVDRYKARLVVRGFSQKEGLDFNETFAPVAKYSSLRLLFARSAALNLDILQLDIKTAFLYGELNEEIYMQQPDGYITPGQEGKVCKLLKSLYGLKQAPRQWNLRIHKFLVDIGFIQLKCDHCVYKHIQKNIILVIWVDDILLFGTDEANHTVYKQLAAQFDVKYIGEPARIVGILVDRNRTDRTIKLHQRSYAEEVLERFGMQQSKPVATPVSKIDSESPEVCKNTPYMSLVGSIMFLMVATRPDLAFAVNILSRALHAPTEDHWKFGKRVLRYITGTKDCGLLFKGQEFPGVKIYSDSDWASDSSDRKSVTGMVAIMGGAAISWITKKQPTVALSTTEAEYQALTEAAKEAIWIRMYLEELGHIQQNPTVILGDNQSSQALAKNPVHHARTKHIDVKFHFLRQHVEEHRIYLQYIQTTEQLADLLTKGLPGPQTKYLRQGMGILPGRSIGETSE